MVPEPSTHKTTQGGEKKHFNREIKEMATALTHRLAGLHHMNMSNSSSHTDHDHEEEQGMGIITLAGTNVGATMRSGMDDSDDTPDMELDQKPLTTYTNSNFQAINNSIMLGGKYESHDPGVHIETIEYVQPIEHGEEKRGKKGKKKGKGGSKKDKHSDGSHYQSPGE